MKGQDALDTAVAQLCAEQQERTPLPRTYEEAIAQGWEEIGWNGEGTGLIGEGTFELRRVNLLRGTVEYLSAACRCTYTFTGPLHDYEERPLDEDDIRD